MNIKFMVFGVILWIMAALFIAGKPWLIQKKYRNSPNLKAYMRKAGLVHGVLGAEGIALAFLEPDCGVRQKGLAVVLGAAAIAAVIFYGVINRKFIKQADAALAEEERPAPDSGEADKERPL